MFRRNVLPKISLVIVLLIVAYFLLFMTMARIPPVTYGNEIDWEFVAISVVLPVAFFATVALGVWRAFTAKDYVWLALQLALFPLAFVYTLFVNTGMGANNSFKPKPLRGSA